MYEIRLATDEDVPALPAIESAAAALFLQYAETANLPDDPTAPAEFYAAQQDGRLWVAALPNGVPIGFALVEMLADAVHLEEVDVHPQYGRQGVGTALVQAVCAWARAHGIAAVTLTTFRRIPWNEPFYRKLGFRELKPAELSANFIRLIEEEESRGLSRALRTAMLYETGIY